MSTSMRVIVTVFAAIVAGWCGYWLGHLFGWSENADWPLSVGGGAGAIMLAIVFSLVAVAVAGRLVGLFGAESPRSPAATAGRQ